MSTGRNGAAPKCCPAWRGPEEQASLLAGPHTPSQCTCAGWSKGSASLERDNITLNDLLKTLSLLFAAFHYRYGPYYYWKCLSFIHPSATPTFSILRRFSGAYPSCRGTMEQDNLDESLLQSMASVNKILMMSHFWKRGHCGHYQTFSLKLVITRPLRHLSCLLWCRDQLVLTALQMSTSHKVPL